ncbi:MAG: OsmC family protein [Promethearchaeota archaeon]
MEDKSKSASKYEVELIWDKQTGGVAQIEGQPQLKFDIPQKYGGLGRYYCADEVFLASLGWCILATFIDFRRKFRLLSKDVKVSLNSSIESRNDGYHITRIRGSLDAIVKRGQKANAERCAALAKEYCHLTRAIRKTIPIEISINILEG